MIEEIKKQSQTRESQTREYQRSGLEATSHLLQRLIRIFNYPLAFFHTFS